MATIASQLLARKNDVDDEALLRLFWNRAELKKEFAQLRRERDQLRDKLRQQEGTTLRVQQRLEQLEGMLEDPLQAANAAVFYQLRGIWNHCRKRLVRMAEEIRSNQEESEQRRFAEKFEDSRHAVMAGINERIVAAKRRITALQQELRAAQERLQRLNGFWNYFKRRAEYAKGDATEVALLSAQAQLDELLQERDDKEAKAPPEYPGLGLKGKRLINLALIALAQELYLHFADRNISAMAREASVRNVGDVSYGRVSQCRELNYQIEQLLRNLEGIEDLATRVRQRASHLRRDAQYRQESDTVPVAGSFAVITARLDNAEKQKTRPSVATNVLADEYWDIYSVLLT